MPKLLYPLIVLLSLAIGAGAASAQPEIYVAFGDSITEGIGDDPGGGGYPTRLEKILRDGGLAARVRNRGLSSEDTAAGLLRINSVIFEGADHMLIMEGTNDIQAEFAVETTLFNLQEMAKRAAAAGMGVTLATLFPRWQFANKDRDNTHTGLIAQLTRDLAGRKDYLLSDVFEIITTIPDFSPDLYADLPGDGIGHPGPQGYDVMASVFGDMLLGTDTVPPVLGVSLPQNYTGAVNPRTDIELEIWDFGEGADLDNTTLRINGVPVAADVTGNPKRGRIFFDPPGELEGIVVVDLVSSDQAETPNTTDRSQVFFEVVGGSTFLGDLDHSGRVDGLDLTYLGLSFGAGWKEDRYIPAADLNLDGIVDGNDLSILADAFGDTL